MLSWDPRGMDRQLLAQDIDAACRLTGEFTLRSGQSVNEYFDKYLFESQPDLLRRVAEAMVPLLPAETELLGGMELGGIPIATMVSSLTGIPAVFVRKEAKEYGTRRVAEGADVGDRHVTLTEDVLTTGGAVRDATRALRQLGANVAVVVCAIDRSGEDGGVLADTNLVTRSVLTKADLDQVRSPSAAMNGLSWPGVWGRVAEDLSESWTSGLGRLLTEDVLRFATVKGLVAQGVPADHIESEWRRLGVPDAVDLVVSGNPRAAIEFKYPREPRETNAAWTQHLGELLKDFYRLAHMPADFDERWCVQLVSPRVQRYLAGVGDRLGVSIAQRAGQVTDLQADVVRGLPVTATRLLGRWLEDARPVQARCVGSYAVGELRLLVHDVAPATLHDGSS